jgi:hypothetical protein
VSEGKNRIRLATEEDLLRDFPDGFMIGIPVRPKPETEEQYEDDADEGVAVDNS